MTLLEQTARDFIDRTLVPASDRWESFVWELLLIFIFESLFPEPILACDVNLLGFLFFTSARTLCVVGSRQVSEIFDRFCQYYKGPTTRKAAARNLANFFIKKIVKLTGSI